MDLNSAAARARQAAAEGDFQALIQLLHASPLELWFGVPPDELATMFAAIPEDDLHGNAAAFLVSRMFLAPQPEQLDNDEVFQAALRDSTELRRWRIFAEGWRARIDGDSRRAYELLREMPQAPETFPMLIDRSGGFRAFFLGQAALTAALAGEFVEALGLYDRLLLAPQTPGLEFLTREARLRAALLHGLFGDRDTAQIHHGYLSSIPRTSSWLEFHLDVEQGLVDALMTADDDADAAFDVVLRLTFRQMGETWPFFIAVLQRLATNAGRRAQMRDRIEALLIAGLGQPAGAGFTGSALNQVLALDSLFAGNMNRAKEELDKSDPQHWRTRLVVGLLEISASSPRRAIQTMREIADQTRGLRQADLRRQLILALAYYLDGETEDALAILQAVGPVLTPSELALARLLSPALIDLAVERLPGWAVDQLSGEQGVLDVPALTPREMHVLEGLSKGRNRREIAADLIVSENTVKSQQRTLYRKLGVNTAEQAVLQAEQRGIF